MKNFIKSILLFIIIIGSLNADIYKDVKYLKLDNGMQVYLLANEKLANTKIELIVNVGRSIETNENAGISHLTEHLMFRDKRIPHNNYLDYIKEEGATYMNGYTANYETGYKATIDSNKSYWITQQFYNMIFDKQITDQNLDSERGAVQTEIGEYRYIDKIRASSSSFLNFILPKKENLYSHEFSIKEEPKFSPRYLQKINNNKITMKQLLEHYDTYYYPKNMVLRIAGNFNISKMENLIINSYGKSKRTGSKRSKEADYHPVDKNKPYRFYKSGVNSNFAYIGFKALEKSYKNDIIIDAYTKNLSLRLKKELRNKNGASYGVFNMTTVQKKTILSSVYFDGLNKNFSDNISIARKMIESDKKRLSEKDILDALKAYEIKISNIEYDSDSFMEIISISEDLRENYNISDKTYTDILKSITINDYREAISELIVENKSYENIYREYSLFKYDEFISQVILMLIFLFVYFKMYLIDMKDTPRAYLLNRRISNRFLGFIYVFLFISLISTIIEDWVGYFFLKYIMGNLYFIETINIPYNLFVNIFVVILSILFFLFLARYIFPYYSNLILTKDRLYIVGHRAKYFLVKDIESIDVVKWNILKGWKAYGMAILFWKPLIKITFSNGEIALFRSNKAIHLKEDLEEKL